MPRRSAALLALTAAACFSDEGVDLSGTTGGPDPSTSEAPGTAGTSTAEPTGTTAEPTTTTTTASETTAAPGCEDPQCNPGAQQDGEPCDVCSVTREVCDRDCTWVPAGCVETEACGYWQYSEKTGWEVRLPPPSDHAPKGPARAAFDLADKGRVVVLTDGEYHVLSPDGAWTGSGAVAALFPATQGPVLQTASLTGDGSYYVSVIAGETSQVYIVDPDTLASELQSESPCCASWTQDVSPPSLQAVRDFFVDLDNSPPWTAIDVLDLCGAEPGGPIPYAAWVTPDAVYVQDGLYCNMMAYASPFAEFPPFAQPGAPPGARIGGLTLVGERLYVFPGD